MFCVYSCTCTCIYMNVSLQKFDAAKYHWSESRVKVYLVVSHFKITQT